MLGGGVGGLSAAHELVERGFQVTVYESRAFGGKARSYGKPRSARGGRRNLPGEHGMRTFPGFYQNLPETLQRIPFGSSSVFANLVSAPQGCWSRAGGRDDVVVNWGADTRPSGPVPLQDVFSAWLQTATGMPTADTSYLASRLHVFFSSCDARRLGEWEQTSWWDFVGAEHRSEDYQRMLVNAITRQILAADARVASARTLGLLWEAGVYTVLGRAGNGSFDRVLDAPTNEAWIDPWVAHLKRLGVRFRLPARVERLEMRGGRVVAARVRTPAGTKAVRADWFVCALPVERARKLWSRAVLAAEPRLAGTASLKVEWFSAIQFYLRRPTPIIPGHVFYVDSPWALTSLGQAQFWPKRDFARDYGNGSVRDCFSVDIGDFDQPGIVYGKPARRLRPAEIAHEVWEQMKAHLNDRGTEQLSDRDLVSWFLDPGLRFRRHRRHRAHRRRGHTTSLDPLMISTPGAWSNRPDAATAIPNLFLAADYVRTGIDTACMEGANEAARRAVGALLDAAGSSAAPPRVYDMYLPPEYEPLRAVDAERYRLGQPNSFDDGTSRAEHPAGAPAASTI